MSWSDIGPSARDLFRSDPDQDALDARMHDPEVLAAERNERARRRAHRLAQTARCAECGGSLGVAFSFTYARWGVYCGRNFEHQAILKQERRGVA